MTQLHKRFTDGQVKVLLDGYCQGLLVRAEIQERCGQSAIDLVVLDQQDTQGRG